MPKSQLLKYILKEQALYKWPPNWHFYEEDNQVVVFIDTIYKDNALILTIDFTKQYPFLRPNVTCNGKNIRLYYKDLFSSRVKSYEEDCINLSSVGRCCNTIMCKNNWSPSFKVVDIVNEFKRIHHCKRRADERFWARLVSKYVLESVPIYRYL